MKKLLIALCLSSYAFAGSSSSGSGGLSITVEPSSVGKDGLQFELGKEDFAKVVSTLLEEKSVQVNNFDLVPEKLEFKSRTILMRSRLDKAQTVILRESAIQEIDAVESVGSE